MKYQLKGCQPANQFASSVLIKEVNVLLHKSLEEFIPEAASKPLTNKGEQTDVAKCDYTLGQAVCVCVCVYTCVYSCEKIGYLYAYDLPECSRGPLALLLDAVTERYTLIAPDRVEAGPQC